jgi:hypothetical protein
VNRNILVTSGKEIKRDSISSVNESRKVLVYIGLIKGKLREGHLKTKKKI